MKTDKLQELINGSDMNQMQKNIFLGFISRAEERETKRAETRDLIEKVYNKCTVEDIPLITDEVIIFKIIGKKDDEWDTKYPYRSIYFKDGKWNRIHTVCTSVDEVLLTYLGEKCLGGNSQFADFAMKMLNMKIEE